MSVCKLLTKRDIGRSKHKQNRYTLVSIILLELVSYPRLMVDIVLNCFHKPIKKCLYLMEIRVLTIFMINNCCIFNLEDNTKNTLKMKKKTE